MQKNGLLFSLELQRCHIMKAYSRRVYQLMEFIGDIAAAALGLSFIVMILISHYQSFERTAHILATNFSYLAKPADYNQELYADSDDPQVMALLLLESRSPLIMGYFQHVLYLFLKICCCAQLTTNGSGFKKIFCQSC